MLLELLPDGPSSPTSRTSLELSQLLRSLVQNTSSPFYAGNMTRHADPQFFVEGGYCSMKPCVHGTCIDSPTGYSCDCPTSLLFDSPRCTLGLALRVARRGLRRSACRRACLRASGRKLIFATAAAVALLLTVAALVLHARHVRQEAARHGDRVRRGRQSNPTMALAALFSLVKVPILALYVVYLHTLAAADLSHAPVLTLSTLRVVFAAAIVAPAVANTAVVSQWLTAMLQRPDFAQFFLRHRATVLLVCALAALVNVNAVKALGCRLFGLAALDAPLRRDPLLRLQNWALLSLLVGEMPRLAVQLYLQFLVNDNATVPALALAISALTLWYNAFDASFARLVRRFRPKLFTVDEGAGVKLGDDIELTVRQV